MTDTDSDNVPITDYMIKSKRCTINIIIKTGKPVMLILVSPLSKAIEPDTVCGLFLLPRLVQLADACI